LESNLDATIDPDDLTGARPLDAVGDRGERDVPPAGPVERDPAHTVLDG
jgi:hypothetical protein